MLLSWRTTVAKTTLATKAEQENYKVLVVDDNNNMRQLLYEILKDQGYQTITAPSGEHAIEVLATHHFHIVITDLNMGRVNGIDVLKKVKALSPHTSVIIATGNSDVTHVIEALRYNADDYILKPFKIDYLLNRISQCLEKTVPHNIHYS